MPAAVAVITISSLSFGYPSSDFQFRVPSLEVTKGERLAIVGPSGSGKTTLLNLIAGILVPQAGTIEVNGKNIAGLVDAQRRAFRISSIGLVFQDFELIDYLNVLDNILHPYRITGNLKLDASVRQRARQLAEDMGIGDKCGNFVHNLSQGEKQRAAICRALLPAPMLILADEATGNLDPENKALILELLFRSVREHEATLVAVTHDHELLPHFDRVLDFQAFWDRDTSHD